MSGVQHMFDTIYQVSFDVSYDTSICRTFRYDIYHKIYTIDHSIFDISIYQTFRYDIQQQIGHDKSFDVWHFDITNLSIRYPTPNRIRYIIRYMIFPNIEPFDTIPNRKYTRYIVRYLIIRYIEAFDTISNTSTPHQENTPLTYSAKPFRDSRPVEGANLSNGITGDHSK